MDNHRIHRLVEAFKAQARACTGLGSPIYGELLADLAKDIENGVKSGMKSPLFRGLKRPLISGKNVRWTGGGGCFRIR